MTDGAFVVVNAVDYADLDVVVLGLLDAEAAGKAFLYRTGPSFPQALAGLEPRPPLQRGGHLARRPARTGTAWSSSARTSASPAGRWRWPANAATSPRSSWTSPPSPTRPAATPTSPT